MTTLSALVRAIVLVALIFLPAVTFAQDDPNQWLKDLATISIWPLAPIIMLGLVCVTDIIKERQRSKLVEKIVNAGQEIPAELLAQFLPENKFKSKETRTPSEKYRDDLKFGIFFICLGLGVGLALSLIFEPKMGLWSLIFIFLSLGSFLNALLISGKAAQQEKHQEQNAAH